MIQIRTFYLAGAILMIFSIAGSIWNAVSVWGVLTNGGAKMSVITGVIFNFLWMGLFAFLYKMTPAQPQKIVNDPEIDNLLKDIKKKWKEV